MQVIAKIENASGLQNIDEILEECDGVMVVRASLASEMPLEKVSS